jgi:hypothetical protein
MDAVDGEDDVGRVLRKGYDVPPPRPEFVADLGRRLQREAAVAGRGGRGRRTIRLEWQIGLGAAAALVLAAGLAAVALRGPGGATPPGVNPDGPMAHGTPGTENTGQRPQPKEETPQPVEGTAGDLVPIPLVLPPPHHAPTPRRYRPRPTLETFQKSRPPLLAPKGTTNVALGKPVTASDPAPIIGENAWVTDGNKARPEDAFVEYGPGLQWVQIDLLRPHVLYAIAVWHFYAEDRVYHDVVVQVSDDPDFIGGVRTIFNNDFDNSSGLGVGKGLEYIESHLGRLIDAKGVTGRYVRLYSRGNTSNDQSQYVEVEVYGKPAEAAGAAGRAQTH